MSDDPKPPQGATPAGGATLSPLKRAFLALEDAQARLAAMEQASREPIAIIGVGCRVPGGADDPASFWQLMRDGRDAVGPVPAELPRALSSSFGFVRVRLPSRNVIWPVSSCE